jgi:hypothetical protein
LGEIKRYWKDDIKMKRNVVWWICGMESRVKEALQVWEIVETVVNYLALCKRWKSFAANNIF